MKGGISEFFHLEIWFIVRGGNVYPASVGNFFPPDDSLFLGSGLYLLFFTAAVFKGYYVGKIISIL